MIKPPIAKAFSEIFVLLALFSAKFVYKRGNDRVMILIIVARFPNTRRDGEHLVTLSGFSKGALCAAGLLGLLASTSAEAGWAANGEYARDDGSVKVRLSQCGGKICVVNTWAKDPQGQEKAGDRFIMTLVSTLLSMNDRVAETQS